MEVTLAYGRTGLAVEVPDDAVVVRPTSLPGLPDEAAAIRAEVEPWLSSRPTRARRAVVVFPDITRPMPNRTVLPPLLSCLASAGLGPDEVSLLCGTGTHRAARPEELAELVGPDIVSRYSVRNHVAADVLAHVEVGTVDGVPVLLDRAWVEADLRIVTGFVEPHFFAGFSGGPKGVCPGIAGLDTILEAHHPRRIADRRATWTVLAGNPVHEFVVAGAALVPPSLSIDVAINLERQVTAVFAGPLPSAYRAACAFVERTAVQRVPGRFDVVVSTNSGYPLDRNLYQAVKGMAAAERVVAPGGTILMAAACQDGVPQGSAFERILADVQEPGALLAGESPPSLDYWQAQVLARVLQQATVQLRSDGLSEPDARRAFLEPVDDLSAAVDRACAGAGSGRAAARVCVLPDGPLTVATPE
jgi:nickel-dependent lactate racemase